MDNRCRLGLTTGIYLGDAAEVAVQKKSLKASATPVVVIAVVSGTVALVVGLSQLKAWGNQER